MKIAFVIHDVGKSGGHERATLEIVNRCAISHDVHIVAYTATDLHHSVKFHRIPVLFKRPFFLKEFFFRLWATVKLRGLKPQLIHSAGNCSFVADVVSVHFCQKRWSIEKKKMNLALKMVQENLQSQKEPEILCLLSFSAR